MSPKKFNPRLIDLSIDLITELNLENYPGYIVSYKTKENCLELTIRLPTRHSQKLANIIDKLQKKHEDSDQLLIVPSYRWASELTRELVKEREESQEVKYID